MALRFHIPRYLRSFTGGRSEVLIEDAPATLGEALEALWRAHPGVRDRVVTEQGALRPRVDTFVGEENIRDTGGLGTPVPPGGEVFIVPAIHGGSDAPPRADLWRTLVLAAIPPLLAATGGLSFPPDFDEPDHFATIELIRRSRFHFDLTRTPSATSPLFLILASLLSLPFRELPVPLLRSFVCLLGSVSLAGIYRILLAKRAPSPWLTCALISVHPDYLWFCYIVMTEIPSLFWGVMAVWVLAARRITKLRSSLAGLFCAASVWTRQLWIFLPVALVLTKAPLRRRILPALPSDSKLAWAGVLGLLMSVPLFLIWGGFSPPIRYATPHDLRLTLAQPVLGLLLLGAYFPVLALATRWSPKEGLVFLLASGAALFAPADFVQS